MQVNFSGATVLITSRYQIRKTPYPKEESNSLHCSLNGKKNASDHLEIIDGRSRTTHLHIPKHWLPHSTAPSLPCVLYPHLTTSWPRPYPHSYTHAYFPQSSLPSYPLRLSHAHVATRSADHPGWSGSGPVGDSVDSNARCGGLR